MSKNWNRIENWLALIAVGVGVLIAGVGGLHVYMTNTAPLYPGQDNVPSVMPSTVLPKWTDAVAQARQKVRARIAEQNLPGLSVAVGVGDEIVWAEGFGWADLEKRVPVTPKLPFRIGTASVALTSAAAGLLLERGQLTLDNEIQTYVPEFPKKPSAVTLRQLMGQIAGVRNDSGDEGPLLSAHCDRPVEALKAFGDSPLLFEPGARYRYSSYGWILVSAAIEAAAHEPFLRFMRTEIFEPLGMDETRADAAPDAIPDRATSYFPRYAAEPRYGPELMRDIDYSCYSGASVFVSTPSDLVRFGIAINSGRLLQPTTVQLLQTPLRLSSGDETGHGLGWDSKSVDLATQHVRVASSDGTLLGGTAASLMVVRERGLVVAVTSNTSYAGTSAIGLDVAAVFADALKPRIVK